MKALSFRFFRLFIGGGHTVWPIFVTSRDFGSKAKAARNQRKRESSKILSFTVWPIFVTFRDFGNKAKPARNAKLRKFEESDEKLPHSMAAADK